jgi:hypothetical protein
VQLLGGLDGLVGGNLRGVGGALLGAAEAAGAGAAGRQGFALRVGDGNDGVVEAGLDMDLPERYRTVELLTRQPERRSTRQPELLPSFLRASWLKYRQPY